MFNQKNNPEIKLDHDHILPSSLSNKDKSINKFINFCPQRSSVFPIESFTEQHQLNYLITQHHPDQLPASEYLICVNEALNQWYQNLNITQIFSANTSIESFSMFLNEFFSSINADDNEQKALFKKQLDSIQQNEDFKSKYLLIKMTLNNLFSLNYNNIEEMIKFAKLIKENNSTYFTEDYKLIFFFGKDLVKIIEQIGSLFDKTKEIDIQLKLLDIILYIAHGFKSLYCYIFYINKMNTLKIDSWSSSAINDFRIDIEKEITSIRKICKISGDGDKTMIACNEMLNEEFSAAVLASKDTLIVYNEHKETLSKYKRFNGRYSFINRSAITDKGRSIVFVYEKRIGFIFSYQHYKSDKLNSIITLFNVEDLSPFKVKDNNFMLTIDYDDKVKELLCFNNIEQDITYNNDHVAIAFDDHLLYILYPNAATEHDSNSNNDSTSTINDANSYTLDIIEINYSHTKQSIQMSFYDTQIISQQEPAEIVKKGKSNATNDFILKPHLSMQNKFFVVNGMLFSSKGKMVYDSKIKKIIDNDKNDCGINIENNTIILNYKDEIICLSRKGDSNTYNEEIYLTCTYEKSNLFTNHSLMKGINQFMSNRLKHLEIRKKKKVNSFNDIFQTISLLNTPIPDSIDIEKNSKGNNPIDIILFSLCHYISIINYHPYHLKEIDKCLKSPYILNIDLPTIKLLIELITITIESKSIINHSHLFSLLTIFNLQIDQMLNLHLSSLHFFTTHSIIEQYISSLISLKTKSLQCYSFALDIIFKLLKISAMSFEYHTTLFNQILQIGIDTIDDLYDNTIVLQSFFSYAVYSSKGKSLSILSIKIVFDLYLKVFDVLINAHMKTRQQLMDNLSLINIILSYQNSLIVMFSEMMKESKKIEIIKKFINALINKINKVIGEMIEGNLLKYEIFPYNLFIYVIQMLVKEFDKLPFIFSLENMAGLIELVRILSKGKKLSEVKEDIISQRDDIIINNMTYAEGISKKVIYELPSIDANKMETQLHYQLIIIPDIENKGKSDCKAILGYIKSYSSKKEKHMINIDNKDRHFQLIQNGIFHADSNCVKIKLFPEAKNYYFKMRISNYNTYQENIDMILSPCVELLNKCLSKLAFYTPDINESSLKYLMNQRMFSSLSNKDQNDNDIKYDYNTFVSYVKDTNLQSIIPLMKSFNHNDKVINNVNEIPLKNTIEQYLLNETYNKLLEDYDQKLNIDNDIIQHKIIKSIFYLILKCENHLCLLNDIKHNYHLLMYIWRECAKMRVYLTIIFNDIKIKQKNFDKEIEIIHLKLALLFNYPYTSTISNHSSLKLDQLELIKFTKNHIDIINFALSSEKCTYELLNQIKQRVFSISFYRIISINILTFIIEHYTNDEVIGNILSTYYNAFISARKKMNIHKGFPSIYHQMHLIGKDKNIIIDKSFNELFSSILKRITTCPLTKFDLSSYINFLLWNIESNSLFDYIQLFNLFNKQETSINLIKPSTFLFNEINPSLMKEIRYIDDLHIGKILSDIFNYYSIVYLKHLNQNDNVINAIMSIIERELIQLYLLSLSSRNNIDELSIKSKLQNILFLLDKIIHIEINFQRNIDIMIKPSILRYIIQLIANKGNHYQNEQIFFNLLKLLSLSHKTHLNKLHALLNDEFDSTIFDSNRLLDDIISISKYEDILIDFFQYWYYNINTDVKEYIDLKIVHNKQNFNYLFFYIKPYCNNHNAIIHTNSEIELQSIIHEFSTKEIEESIIKGYSYSNWFIIEPKIPLKMKILNDIEEDPEDSLKKPLNNDYYLRSHYEDVNKINSEDEKIKKMKKRLKESKIITKDLLPFNRTILLNNDNIDNIIKPNVIHVNSNNIINNYSNESIPIAQEEKNLIEHCLTIIERDLSMIKELNACEIKDCFIILQFLIKASNNDNKFKERINEFLIENDEIIKSLLHYELQPFNHTIISKEKIEDFTLKAIALERKKENEIKKVKGEIKESSLFEEKNNSDIKGRFMIETNQIGIKMVTLFNKNDRYRKVFIPLVKYTRLDTDILECDMNTFVIDMEEYQKIINEKEKTDLLKQNKENNDNEEKENEVNEKKDKEMINEERKDNQIEKTKNTIIFLNNDVINFLNASVIKKEVNFNSENKSKLNRNTKNKIRRIRIKSKQKRKFYVNKMNSKIKLKKKDILEEKEEFTDSEEDNKENNEEANFMTFQSNPSQQIELTQQLQNKFMENKLASFQEKSSTLNKKNDKSKTDIIGKNHTNSLWDPFNAALDTLYDTSCIFLIDTTQSCLLKSKTNILYYQSYHFSTNQLSNKALPSYLKSKFPSFKEKTVDLILSQLLKQKGSLYTSLISSYKLSKNKSKNKDDKAIIPETFINEEFSYGHILRNFPTEDTFHIDNLKNYTIYLLKYYLRMLLIIHSKQIDSISLQAMFYITDFYKNFFNLPYDYNHLHQYLHDHINMINSNFLTYNHIIINHSFVLHDERDFKLFMQDRLLKELFMICNSKNEELAKSLMKIIISKCWDCLKNNEFNKLLMMLNLILSCLNMTTMTSIIMLFLNSKLIKGIDMLYKKKELQQQDQMLLNYLAEILLRIMAFFDSYVQIKFNRWDLHQDNSHKKLYSDYLILSNNNNNLLQSNELINKLISETEEYTSQITTTLSLPIEVSKCLVRYTDNKAYSFTLSKNKEEEVVIGSSQISTIDISTLKMQILNQQQTINTDSKDIIIVKDTRQTKTYFQNNTDKTYSSYSFINYYQFSEKEIIAKDSKGQYYISKKDDICKYSLYKPLEDIKKTESIISIANHCIVTNQSIYISCGKKLEIIELTVYNSILRRLAIPITQEVIGASYCDSSFVYWTKNKVFGGGKTKTNIFWKDSRYDSTCNIVKEIFLPNGSFYIIKLVLLQEMLIFLLYDKQSKTNKIYANGYYSIRNDYNKRDIFNEEIEPFIDENIQEIVSKYDNIMCISSKNELIAVIGSQIINYDDIPLICEDENNQLQKDNIILTEQNIIFQIFNKKNNRKWFYKVSKANAQTQSHLYTLIYDTEDHLIEKKNKKRIWPSSLIFINDTYSIVGDYYSVPIEMVDQVKSDKQKESEMSLLFKIYMKIKKNAKEVIKGYQIKLKQVDKNMSLMLFDVNEIENDIKDQNFKEGELYHILDESETQGNYNCVIIEQLYLFAKSFKSITQLGLIDISKQVSMNYPIDIMLKSTTAITTIYSFYKEPKTHTITIQNNHDMTTLLSYNSNDAIKIIKCEIEEKMGKISLDHIKEYLNSKHAYYLSETNRTNSNNNNNQDHQHSLNEYIKEKYKDNKQYNQLSNEKYLDIIHKTSEYYTSALVSFRKFAFNINSIPFAHNMFLLNDLIETSIRKRYINQHFFIASLTINPLPIVIDNQRKLFNYIYQLTINYNQIEYVQLNISFNQSTSYDNDKTKIDNNFIEVLNALFKEIIEGKINSVPLFIPTPNHIKKIGMLRNCYTINNSALGENVLTNYMFIGKLIGVCLVRKFNVKGFPIVSPILKQILYNNQYLPQDIDEIDHDEYIRVFNRESNLDGLVFNCHLSNGQCVDLIKNGSNRNVTIENYEEFKRLYLRRRYNETREQVLAMQRGLQEIIPKTLLFWFTMIEMNDCFNRQDSNKKKIDDLLQNALYEGYNASDLVIKWLWEFLNQCTMSLKEKYIKGIYGCDNIDITSNNKHIIRLIEGRNNDDDLPIMNQIIHRIDLPKYSTYDILSKQLTHILNNLS